MKYFGLLICVFIGMLVGCSKNVHLKSSVKENSSQIDSTNREAEIVLDFPYGWEGKWCGDLMIYDSLGLSNTIPMALKVSKTDSLGVFDWTIIYGRDSLAQVRAYQLLEIDKRIGHYVVDEKNSILLDAYMRNDELTSIFEVMDNNLIICYKMQEDHILFTVKFFPAKEVRNSGGSKVEGNDIPIVKSYHLKSTQTAKLYKKCLVE